LLIDASSGYHHQRGSQVRKTPNVQARMMTQPTEPPPGLTRKLMWFVAFWLLGVCSIAAVGLLWRFLVKSH